MEVLIGRQSLLLMVYIVINQYIHEYMVDQGHAEKDKYPINILFILSSYRVVIELDNKYQLDFRNTELGDLLGFDKKIIIQEEYSAQLPNITNNIDKINIHSNIVTNSILSGNSDNLLAVIPVDNLTRSYTFKFEPRKIIIQ